MGLSMTSLAERHAAGRPARTPWRTCRRIQGERDHRARSRAQVITEIFGKKAGVGLAVLMDQMDRLKSKYPAITAGANQFGDAWAKTQQNLSQQWDELRMTFEALLTGIGEKLIPVLSSIAGFLLQNKGIITTLAPVILGLVAGFALFAGAMKIVKIGMEAWTTATKAVRGEPERDARRAPGPGDRAGAGRQAHDRFEGEHRLGYPSQ